MNFSLSSGSDGSSSSSSSHYHDDDDDSGVVDVDGKECDSSIELNVCISSNDD